MNLTPEEIGAKMDALGLWQLLEPFNFAVKPRGTVFPYFCSVMHGDGRPVKVRFLMLEGWQTMHDYIRTRIDNNFGFYSSPCEMPHLELVVLMTGEARLFRHDAGYVPLLANDAQRALAAKILWEAYGVMLRIESDSGLPLKFADEKAIFARVETADGAWEDRPLTITEANPHVEKITFTKEDVRAVKDLPFVKDAVWSVDFAMLPAIMTKDPRPRSVYGLKGIDVKSGEVVFDKQTSMHPEAGLRGMWESVPSQVVREFIQQGKVPGEIQVRSGRLFRFLRTICLELPLKLSLHDQLAGL